MSTSIQEALNNLRILKENFNFKPGKDYVYRVIFLDKDDEIEDEKYFNTEQEAIEFAKKQEEKHTNVHLFPYFDPDDDPEMAHEFEIKIGDPYVTI